MKRIISVGILLLFAIVGVHGQPKAGDFTVEYVLGKSLTPTNAIDWTPGVGTPVLSNPSPEVDYHFDNAVKMRVFMADKFAMSFVLGYGQKMTPAQDESLGVPYQIDDNGHPVAGSGVPFVQATSEQKNLFLKGGLGMEFHMTNEDSKLDPYLGFSGAYTFARSENIARTFLDESAAADGEYYMVLGAGPRWSDAAVISGRFAFGVDYYLGESFYVGMEMGIFDYTYSYQIYVPEAGVSGLSNGVHGYSALSYPKLRIGFSL